MLEGGAGTCWLLRSSIELAERGSGTGGGGMAGLEGSELPICQENCDNLIIVLSQSINIKINQSSLFVNLTMVS